MKSVAIFYNPQSGNRPKDQQLEQLRTYLVQEGMESQAISVIKTESASHAFDMAKAASLSGVDLIVAIGGDGTINKIASGLYAGGGKASLGIIPAGTVNNVAKALGIPLDWQKAVQNLTRGIPRAIDLCQANDRYMMSSLTLGMLADLALEVKQEEKRRLGFLAFLKYAVATLRRNRHYYLTLNYGSHYRQVKAKILLITMMNAVAGQVHFDPEARPDDGLMSVYLVSRFNIWKTWWYLPRFLAGDTRKLPEVQHFRTNQLDISQFKHGKSQRARTRIDGDKSVYLPLSLKVIPLAIRVMVPQNIDSVKKESRLSLEENASK